MIALVNAPEIQAACLALLHSSLLVGIAIAAGYDLKQRRIPNLINGVLLCLGLSFYLLFYQWGGLWYCCKGVAFGFILFFPAYLLGGVGAGDVKLMAAIGAVLGVEYTWQALLFIAVTGGVAALGLMVVRGELLVRLHRIGLMFYGLFSGLGLEALKVERSTIKRDGIPYGMVIAAGVTLFFVWRWWSGQGMPVPQIKV